MTIHTKPALGQSSPREIRAANDPVAVRDINTGSIIAYPTEDTEYRLLQHVGRVGDIDIIEVSTADEETFEVYTYTYSHGMKAEIIAYLGTMDDRDKVNDALFPMAHAAE